MTDTLHVFTARFNPIGWRTPHQHYVDWAQHMQGLGADVTCVECAYGETPFECDVPGVTHIGVRADSWAWTKENLLNLGIARRQDAKYICWSDSDVFPRRKDFCDATIRALQHYHVVQPWEVAYDLGPGDSHAAVWCSFAHQYLHGHPIVVGEGEDFHKFWKAGGGVHDYPHPGYMWAAKRSTLSEVGGLFEYAGMGAADHHQAVAMLGRVHMSIPRQVSHSYRSLLESWERRARHAINGRIGYVQGTIEHRFHGSKQNRQYWDRWQMFLRHGFDPNADLKRNTHGVLEFAGNKPQLELEWDQYLRMRWEDDNGRGFGVFLQPPDHWAHDPQDRGGPARLTTARRRVMEIGQPPYPTPVPMAIEINPPVRVLTAEWPHPPVVPEPIYQVRVTTSDGSPFAGELTIEGSPPVLRWDGDEGIFLNRKLRLPDVGRHDYVAMAMQGGVVLSGQFTLIVNPPMR